MDVSVVIPTFENPELVARALRSCLIQQGVQFEVLVSDDSRTDSVLRLVDSLGDPRIRYHKHSRTTQPVDNWNDGLSLAQGTNVVLLHQDESFLHTRALADGAAALRSGRGVYVFGLCVRTAAGDRPRSVLWTRVLRRCPQVVYFSNFIGSPSNVMFVRATLRARFRPDLRWMVDLEWFFRNFANGPLVFSGRLDLLSSADTGMSITKSLNVSEVERREVRQLLGEHRSWRVKAFLWARLLKRWVKDMLGRA